MPLVKTTLTGKNYLEKINTDGDICTRTAIRSYNKQLGINGMAGRTRFYLPFSFEPGSHTLWVFINGEKAVVEPVAFNNRQYIEVSNNIIQLGGAVAETDVLEFIVAGAYLGEVDFGAGGGGLTWVLVNEPAIPVQNYYGYMANTSMNPIVFTLPADPSEGETFAVIDAFGTFGTNSVTLLRNGKTINGFANDMVLNKNGTFIQLVYDGIGNWIPASSGDPYVQRDDISNNNRYLTFVENSVPGQKRLNMDTDLYYNPSTNVLYTTANRAFYADLAENYLADANYSIGTVLSFGGEFEVTEANTPYDTRVAGVVSEKPAYLMNEGLKGEYVTMVALIGRVSCYVLGPVDKGDLLVSSFIPGVARRLEDGEYKPGCVIGKSLESIQGEETKLIEVVVGKL